MSRRELAALVGASRSAVQTRETGHASPFPAMAPRLRALLQLQGPGWSPPIPAPPAPPPAPPVPPLDLSAIRAWRERHAVTLFDLAQLVRMSS